MTGVATTAIIHCMMAQEVTKMNIDSLPELNDYRGTQVCLVELEQSSSSDKNSGSDPKLQFRKGGNQFKRHLIQ